MLSVTAGTGTVDFQSDIGATAAVESLTVVSAASTDVQNVTTRDGGISITSTAINLEGAALSSNAQATAGAISLTGAVSLRNNVTIDSDATTDGNVTVTGTVDADNAANNRTLNVTSGDGIAAFTGSIGSVHGLADFDATASLIRLGGLVRVDQGIAATTTLTGNVQLEGIVLFDLDGANDHSLIVTGTVDADAAANDRILAVVADSGSVDFQGDIGTSEAADAVIVFSATTTNLQSVDTRDGGISITSTTIQLNGSTLSTIDQVNAGGIFLNGTVVLNSDVAMTTDSTASDGNVTATGTINADLASNARMLTVTAGTGDVDFQAGIGNAQALDSLMVVSSGNTTVDTVTTNGTAGININASVDITANGNLLAAASGAGESIVLRAQDDIFIADAVTRISTRDLEADADSITIVADADPLDPNAEGDGIGGVRFPASAGFSVETDQGIAKSFAPRPVVGATDAFFTAAGNPVISVAPNVTSDNLEFRTEWTLTSVGVAGEENLRIDIDWRDPNNEGGVFPDTATGNTVTTDRQQMLTIAVGGNMQILGHVYTSLDFVIFVGAGAPFFDVDFSVSHHESISVRGVDITQDGTTSAVDGPPFAPAGPPPFWLISSTDNSATGTGVADPNTNVTNDVASNTDLHFEGGLLKVSVPTLQIPEIEPDVPPPPPQPAPAPPPATAPEPQVLVTLAQPVEFPYSSYTEQSEDYFQLRVSDGKTLEVVDGFERIPDEFGDLLLQPARLKEWVKREDFDGPGYELWLITTKRTKGGATLKIERPVLKFDVADQEPFPAQETLPDEFPKLQLEPMPTGEEDENSDSGEGQDDIGQEQPEINADGNDDVNARIDRPASGGDASEVTFVPSLETDDDTAGQPVQPLSSAGMARSAIAGLTVSGVMARSRRRKRRRPRHTALLNRVCHGTESATSEES